MNCTCHSPTHDTPSATNGHTAAPPANTNAPAPANDLPPPTEKNRHAAAMLLDPEFQATYTLAQVRPMTDPHGDLLETLAHLKHITALVHSGDLQHPTSLAVTQATVLNVMFSRLTEHAMAHIDAPYFESLMRLALRAQHQSLRALDTLRRLMAPSNPTPPSNADNPVRTNSPPNSPPPSAPSPGPAPKSTPAK